MIAEALRLGKPTGINAVAASATGELLLLNDVRQPLSPGAVRALAVTARSRVAELPDIPTTKEAGLPEVEMYGWVSLFAPAGTPKDVIERINSEVNAALKETEAYWQKWTRKCEMEGKWSEAVIRSLITLKALTYGPTGGIVAAPTTSLRCSSGSGSPTRSGSCAPGLTSSPAGCGSG